MENELHPYIKEYLTRSLYDLMSKYTLEVWKSYWINGIEFEIWEQIIELRILDNISDVNWNSDLLDKIALLAKTVNGFYIWTPEDNAKFVSLEEWICIYNKWAVHKYQLSKFYTELLGLDNDLTTSGNKK